MIVKRNLGDIAELTAGVISQRVLADKEDGETGDSVFVLVPKAIHDGELDENCLSTEMLKKDIGIKQYGKFLARDGDIVMKFSSPYDACKVIMKDVDKTILVPSFCCRIRITDPSVDAEYLVTFLNSSSCRKELDDRCHTRTINLTRKSDLEEIEVPILTPEKQKEIARRYMNLLKLKKQVSALMELEDERNTVLFDGE